MMDRKRRHFHVAHDILTEAVEAIRGRRTRSYLTLAGVALGILTLVATVGLTASAAAQVSARFDALKATRVIIEGFTSEEVRPVDRETRLRPPLIDRSAIMRTQKLNGVVAAGTVSLTQDELPMVSRASVKIASAGVETPVMAVDPDALVALRARPTSGRLFDWTQQNRHHPVVLLGDIAARNLHIDPRDPSFFDGRTMLFIAGRPYLLMGVVKTPDFDSQLPLAAVVPEWVSRDPTSKIHFGNPQVVIQARAGAAQQIGVEAKYALDPARPERLIAQVPPDPKQLRAKLESDTRSLFLAMAGVSLVIGAIGIGNTTLVAVLERRHEIGLRRAIGASRRSIMIQFLLESGVLGLLGGVVGTIAGLDLAIGITLARDWTAAISPWLIGVGPLLGLAVGLFAGLYPAAKAARIEPVVALTM